jgi:saccharopine dehydrogenase (NAD+, L-lysine-forming)
MSRVLIIGAGGVGRVVAHKCAAREDLFEAVCLASRNEDKCRQIAGEIARPIETATVDGDVPAQVSALIRQFKADIVINVALPYQDLTIMDGCLDAGAHYIDTANYEPRDEAKFEYKWQWEYQDRFRKAGLTAVLGSGFDPGVTNVYCAWAQKHHFDSIRFIDILDCNAGDHGYPFATNFNPEINLREVSANGRFWENGEWVETMPLEFSCDFPYPEVGSRKSFLLYHEELESLCRNIRGLKRIRFWMTFGESYLKHLEVLRNVGMTGIEPVDYNGVPVVPIEFLKKLLPDPATLGPRTVGRTCIGCLISGEKDGIEKSLFIYNSCDHQECYREVRSQAVSYTTGVPAMIGAAQIANGNWKIPGVHNMEQLDPDPFMDELNRYGLPWHVVENPDHSMTFLHDRSK